MRKETTVTTRVEVCERYIDNGPTKLPGGCPNEHRVVPDGRVFVVDKEEDGWSQGHSEPISPDGWFRIRAPGGRWGNRSFTALFCSEEHAREYLAQIVLEPATSDDFAYYDSRFMAVVD